MPYRDLIDIDELVKSIGFKKLMGYINTTRTKQLKGDGEVLLSSHFEEFSPIFIFYRTTLLFSGEVVPNLVLPQVKYDYLVK